MELRSRLTSSDTETSHVVPKDGKGSGFPLKGGGERTVDGKKCGGTDDSGGRPVDVLEEVAPGDVRKSFCSGEGMLDVVVGDVGVGGDVALCEGFIDVG